MHENWRQQFHELFFTGVKRYEAGRHSPESMFETEDTIFPRIHRLQRVGNV